LVCPFLPLFLPLPLQDGGLAEVALLSTLRCVSLKGCEDVTDDGIARLARLPRLSRLVLRNCVKLTDLGLAKLAGMSGRELPQLWSPVGGGGIGPGSPPPVPRLRSPAPRGGGGGACGQSSATVPGQGCPPRRPPLASLDLGGCVLLTERGFAAMASGLGGGLTELLIGGCSRVSTVNDAMLVAVGRCRALQALDMAGCTHITDDGGFSVCRFDRNKASRRVQLGWVATCTACMVHACLCSPGSCPASSSILLNPAENVLCLPGVLWVCLAGMAHLAPLLRLTSLNLWNCLRVTGERCACCACCACWASTVSAQQANQPVGASAMLCAVLQLATALLAMRMLMVQPCIKLHKLPDKSCHSVSCSPPLVLAQRLDCPC
jgi:hypothetical protein